MESNLKKRVNCYIQPPRVFDIAPCSCGNADTQWSEYEGHLWCAKCEKDFIPEHTGIFSGPIPAIGRKRRRMVKVDIDAAFGLPSVKVPPMPPVKPPKVEELCKDRCQQEKNGISCRTCIENIKNTVFEP